MGRELTGSGRCASVLWNYLLVMTEDRDVNRPTCPPDVLLTIFFLLAGLQANCCGDGDGLRWETVAQLNQTMNVQKIVVLSGDAVVVMGHVGPRLSARLRERRATIVRVEGRQAITVYSGGEGWIQAGDSHVSEVWAVHAVLRPEGEGSLYSLLISADAGRTWEGGRPIPATSLTSIVIDGLGCGWAIGASNLWRTCDSGATWRRVEINGVRGLTESAEAIGRGQLLLGGASLRRTDDGGLTWRMMCEEEVVAIDGEYVVGRTPEGVRVGRLDSDTVGWRGFHRGNLYPSEIGASGTRLTILTAPLDHRAGRGLVLLRSDDGGATFEEEYIRGPSKTSILAMDGPDVFWHVTQNRRLRVRRPMR